MPVTENKTHCISEHIIALLNDTSFPPLVMLDGDWGEGKTYFTKNTLIPELKSKGYKCVFFSLTGLANINDFKDRLLSASYIKNEINSEEGNSISTIFTSIISQFGGENGGTVASILSGASGLVKESMLSRLSDRTIIVDDLDRITDKKLCDLIIGECLQLSDDSNLKFIFIVNDKKNLADTAMKEKVFSGIVRLNKNLTESVEIAFGEYSWFDTYREYVMKAIERKEIKNLRVLKRASKKIDEIFKVLQCDESLNLHSCMSNLISVTILVIFYHYEKGFSESDIWEKSEYVNMLPNEKNKKYQYADLVEISSFLTREFISYCVGGSNWYVSIEDFGRLPKNGCPIDAFIFSAHFQHDDLSFEHKVDTLQKFVFDDVNVPFSKWFEASYFYYFLQFHEFFSLERPVLSDSFEYLVKQKNFDYSDLDRRTHRLKFNSENNFVYEKYVEQRDSHITEQEQDSHSDVLTRMMRSWKDVDIEIYRSHQLKSFFNQFSINQLTDCIDGWENSDLLLFSDFISERYKASNIRSYLSEELDILSQLLCEVNIRREKEPAGRRKGALRLLKYNLLSAQKTLNTDQ